MTAEKRVVGNAPHLQDLFPKHPAESQSFNAFWSSPEKFAAEIEGWDEKKAWHNAGWDTDEDFHGTKNMGDAIKLARYGWMEGVSKIKGIRDRINAAHPLTKQPITYGIAGSVPNVPRAIAGNPLNMKATDLAKSRRRPVITLLSDMGANCGHNADEFIQRAAVVCALIDKIEAAGYSCAVIGYSASKAYSGSKLTCQVSVMLKNSNQPVDIPRLAFGLGHPAMFRRLVFAQKGMDHFNKPLGGGLGSAFALDSETLKERAIYIIPSINRTSCFETEAKAVTEGLQYIREKLKEQGCPAV